MGILSRIATITKANLNALLDKAEDPEKMVDQILRELREKQAEVRKQTAGILAREDACKDELDACVANIEKMENRARNALKAGAEDDARKILEAKSKEVAKKEKLEERYQRAHESAENARADHDNLVEAIRGMEEKREDIKATAAEAKAQNAINKATSGINSTASIEAFDRMEAKAKEELNKARAEARLNRSIESENIDNLMDKYAGGSSADVDDEMARLKAEMGL